MNNRRLLLGVALPCVMLAALLGSWTGAAAEATIPTAYVPGGGAALTVAVLPLQAEVRLDGVSLGSAHDLIARTVTILPGDHVVEVWAPGYLPSIVNVSGIADWASHIHLELVPNRQP